MWEFYITQSPMHTAGAYSMQSIGWHDMACKCSTDQGLMVVHACHAPCKIYIYIYSFYEAQWETKFNSANVDFFTVSILYFVLFFLCFCFFGSDEMMMML